MSSISATAKEWTPGGASGAPATSWADEAEKDASGASPAPDASPVPDASAAPDAPVVAAAAPSASEDAVAAALGDKLSRVVNVERPEGQIRVDLGGTLQKIRVGFPQDPSDPGADTFEELQLKPAIIEGITRKGWLQTSMIQRVGLPLALANPATSLIGQAQTGLGKTAVFVITALSRINEHAARQFHPQVLIMSPNKELNIQITEEINGKLGVDGSPGDPGLGQFMVPGRKMAIVVQGNEQRGGVALDGDFSEPIIVGTAQKLKSLLDQGTKPGPESRRRKPYIDPDNVILLVLDEADEMLSSHGDHVDAIFKKVTDWRRKKARGAPPPQSLLFSATFNEQNRLLARKFVSGGGRLEYSELKVDTEKLSLDKVAVFYMLVGNENDSIAVAHQKKNEALYEVWLQSSDKLKGQGIFFANTKQRVGQVGQYLCQRFQDANKPVCAESTSQCGVRALLAWSHY